MTYIKTPRLETLYADLRALRWSDPGAIHIGIATNGYAVLSCEDGEAVYVDVNVPPLFPLVEQLDKEGYAPAAILLSHNHVALTGREGIKTLRKRYGVPIFLHPLDAEHPHLQGLEFEDPVGSPLLAKFNLEVKLFPGQTPGSVVAYWHRHGTVMLAGDSATGATTDEEARGIRRVVRPPYPTSWDDGELRRQWEAFDRNISGIAPYHGAIYLDAAKEFPWFLQSLRHEAPTMMGFVTGREKGRAERGWA